MLKEEECTSIVGNLDVEQIEEEKQPTEVKEGERLLVGKRGTQ